MTAPATAPTPAASADAAMVTARRSASSVPGTPAGLELELERGDMLAAILAELRAIRLELEGARALGERALERAQEAAQTAQETFSELRPQLTALASSRLVRTILGASRGG